MIVSLSHTYASTAVSNMRANVKQELEQRSACVPPSATNAPVFMHVCS